MSKKEIRREVLAARRALSDTQVHELSLLICENIRKSKVYQEAENVCLYMPINNEADVALLLDRVYHDGKTAWLPRVHGDIMEFHYFDQETPVVIGDFNITEPDSEEILQPDEKTLIIMPGAVFSVSRDRIGYGGGYYDKYLEKHPDVKTMAACFELQIRDEIPTEPHDIKPQALVSEKRIIEE